MTSRCLTESDGMHQHEYRIRDAGTGKAATVTEHLHSWNDEHFAEWPDAKPVDVTTGSAYLGTYEVLGKYDTLAEAWAAHASGDLPAITCQKAAQR